jgi:hypothetical protein
MRDDDAASETSKPMCSFWGRINGLINESPLNKPANMDEKQKRQKTASSFVNVRPVVPSSAYRTADPSINVRFSARKSRTSDVPIVMPGG